MLINIVHIMKHKIVSKIYHMQNPHKIDPIKLQLQTCAVFTAHAEGSPQETGTVCSFWLGSWIF